MSESLASQNSPIEPTENDNFPEKGHRKDFLRQLFFLTIIVVILTVLINVDSLNRIVFTPGLQPNTVPTVTISAPSPAITPLGQFVFPGEGKLSDSEIAYIDGDAIWLINSETGNEQKIIQTRAGYFLDRPMWSPNHQKLAYFEYNFEHKYQGENWILKVLDFEKKQIWQLANINRKQQYWTEHLNRECLDWLNPDTLIWVDSASIKKCDFTTQKISELSKANSIIANLQVVNDVIFFSTGSEVKRFDLESLQTKVLFSAYANFEVSPNGAYLLYVTQSTDEENKVTLWLGDTQGNTIRKFGETGPCAGFERLKFFPNSEKFTYVEQCGDGITVSVLDLKGQQVDADFGMLYYNYSWSPDGNSFVTYDWLPRYTIIEPQDKYIGLFNSDGSLLKKLIDKEQYASNAPGSISCLEWGSVSY